MTKACYRVAALAVSLGIAVCLMAASTIQFTAATYDFGIQFQFAAYSVIEDGGMVVLRVVRGDDGTLPVTVDFFTMDTWLPRTGSITSASPTPFRLRLKKGSNCSRFRSLTTASSSRTGTFG